MNNRKIMLKYEIQKLIFKKNIIKISKWLDIK